MSFTMLFKQFIHLMALFILLSSICACWSSHLSDPQRADSLRKSGSHEEAIELYRHHIESRLNDSTRAPSENPYFYELIIGDILLEQRKVDEALVSYRSAQDHSVDRNLISDRIRQVGRWFEKNGDYDKAIEFLKENRSLDELSIDYEIDRIYREMIEREESETHKK